jgi:hypothetical protein
MAKQIPGLENLGTPEEGKFPKYESPDEVLVKRNLPDMPEIAKKGYDYDPSSRRRMSPELMKKFKINSKLSTLKNLGKKAGKKALRYTPLVGGAAAAYLTDDVSAAIPFLGEADMALAPDAPGKESDYMSPKEARRISLERKIEKIRGK